MFRKYNIRQVIILTILFLTSLLSFSQGSWQPAGADLSFPRTLLDSLKVPEVRKTLSDPEIVSLYQSIWLNANSQVPADDSTDGGRINRAMIAKEAAFVILMDRKCENGNILPLPSAERDSLIAKSRWLLENMNTDVGYQSGWVFYQEWQHRSKELIAYLIAYDLLRGAGVNAGSLQVAQDSLIRFTANLYHRAMDVYTVLIFQFRFFNFQFNNHSIMTASALGLAAVVFNDSENAEPDKQPKNWINAGLWNLDNTLWVESGTYPRVSEPDTLAGYAEGPAYFDYAFQNAFPFIRALGNFLPDAGIPVTFNQITREIPNPWYDTRYDRLYDWMNKIRMPMGDEPAIHDSPVGFGTRITALSGKPRYNRDNPFYTADDPFIRCQYIAANVTHGAIEDSLFQALPAAGSLVFRSGWDSLGIYLHFIGKHGIALSGAKSHHQGDASGFSLFAFGQLMVADPGYPGASESDVVNKASDHSLILVNGNGPVPPNGEFVNTLTNTCYIENYFDAPDLDYGEVNTTYYAANIIRKTLFVRNRYFLIGDFISSALLNTYTFQLQGNGLAEASPQDPEGAFYADFAHYKGIYQRDSVSLIAMVLSENGNGIYTYELDSLAASSGTYRHYSKMLVSDPVPANDAVFLTTLFPDKSDNPTIQAVFGEDSLFGTSIITGGYKDLIFARKNLEWGLVPASLSGLPNETGGNGLLNFFSTDTTDQCIMVFLEKGDSASYGTQPMLVCDHPLDLFYQKISPGVYSGFCSDTGIISLYSPHALKVIQGNLQMIEYDQILNLCKFRVNARGNFRLEISDDIQDQVTSKSFSLSVWPNPASGGHFTLSIETPSITIATIDAADLSGRILLHTVRRLVPGVNQVQMNLNQAQSGNYKVTVHTSSVMRTAGVIIP